MAPRQKTRNGRPKSGGLGPFVFTQRYRFRGLQRRSFLPVLTLPSTRNGRPKSGGLGPFVFTQRYRFRGLQRRSFLPVLTLPSIDFSPGSKLVTNISAS